MKKNLLDMNLQFFADEGAEDPGAAEPEESTGEEPEVEETEEGEPEADSDGGENTDPAEPAPQQTPDQNAVFANIRRQAEADAQKKFQEQQKQIHFDFQTDNLDSTVKKAEKLGAKITDKQFGEGLWVTMEDPSGHLFCLCKKENPED